MILDERHMDVCSGSGVWDHNLHCSSDRGVSRSTVLGNFWSRWNSTVVRKRVDQKESKEVLS